MRPTISGGFLLAASLAGFLASHSDPAIALHIIPDHLGDPHFTSGPCPNIAPLDGAACPNGTSTCPAFYNPRLLPAGYNSVAYCANVPSGIGFMNPGFTLLTKALDVREQQAFLRAAKKVESYVKDEVTVVTEPYKVGYLDGAGNSYAFFGGNEYWNPVCGADSLLPPYSTQPPTLITNPDGSLGYHGLPETYTAVLRALKRKNAVNETPMELVRHLPSYSQINVEWPSSFFAWVAATNLGSFIDTNFLVGPSGHFPVAASAKPFTLCAAPAAMKMLGLAPAFRKNGHTIDDINSPQYNMNVTLPGTDGAIVIPEHGKAWIYDTTDPTVVATQLPKAYFERTLDLNRPYLSCGDAVNCAYPDGYNGGGDLIGVFNHEINHILGVMESQYYKIGGEGTALAYTYGTALFLLDLFDLDSDYVVPGFGHPGIRSYADFRAAPRNNNAYAPTTVWAAPTPAGLTPWVQFGLHDHVVVYELIGGVPRFFPVMDGTTGNPDGDIQLQRGTLTSGPRRRVFIDPILVNLPPMDVVHYSVQAGGYDGTIFVDTIREYSELAANGWDIDYSTLKDPYHTVSPLAKWYQTCFDANGVFTVNKNAHCKFSVKPQDLAFLH